MQAYAYNKAKCNCLYVMCLDFYISLLKRALIIWLTDNPLTSIYVVEGE